jgi:hypothetical protein
VYARVKGPGTPHPSPQRKQGNTAGLTVDGCGFPRSRVGLLWEWSEGDDLLEKWYTNIHFFQRRSPKRVTATLSDNIACRSRNAASQYFGRRRRGCSRFSGASGAVAAWAGGLAVPVTIGFLLRVFIDIDRTPMEVVTVYRTSKIDKYWRVE